MTRTDSPTTPPVGEADLWAACVEHLAQDIPEQQFNTWIRPLVAKASDDGD
jgi:chromosomal replication initiator protein